MIYIDLGTPSDNRCGKEPATEPVNSLLHYTITLVNRDGLQWALRVVLVYWWH